MPSHSLRGGEEVAAVGADAVNGALVTLQLAQSPQRVRVPQFEHPASAAAQQHRGPRDHAQRAHPVTVGVGDLLVDRTDEGEKECGPHVNRTLLVTYLIICG